MTRNRASLPIAAAALLLVASGAAAQDAEAVEDEATVTIVEPVEDADVTVEGEPVVNVVTVEPAMVMTCPAFVYTQSAFRRSVCGSPPETRAQSKG